MKWPFSAVPWKDESVIALAIIKFQHLYIHLSRNDSKFFATSNTRFYCLDVYSTLMVLWTL